MKLQNYGLFNICKEIVKPFFFLVQFMASCQKEPSRVVFSVRCCCISQGKGVLGSDEFQEHDLNYVKDFIFSVYSDLPFKENDR